MKKLLKKIDETDDVAWKEGSEQRKSVCTEENTELVEMILSQDDQVVDQIFWEDGTLMELGKM